MVSMTGGDGRSAQHPVMPKRADREFQTQAVTETTKVVKAAHSLEAARQGARASDHMVQAHAEGGIESFDEGGIDRALLPITQPRQSFDWWLRLVNMACGFHKPPASMRGVVDGASNFG